MLSKKKHINLAAIETRALKFFLWMASKPQDDTAISLRLHPYPCTVLKTFDVFLNVCK